MSKLSEMDGYVRKTYAALLIAVGTLSLSAASATAQIARVGNVLSAEIDGPRCTLVLTTETDEITTHYADTETCERVNAGDRIEYQSEITQVNIFSPPESGLITDVVNGDRACYFTLTDADNNTIQAFASFDVCESRYIGQQVRLTYDTANVLAFSCNGDIECGRTELATIISQVEIVEADIPEPPPTELPPTEPPTEPPPTEPPTEPNPPESAPTSLVSELPDGNYRYWDGPVTDEIVPTDSLSSPAQFVFTFSKQGNDITGIFAEVDAEAICVQGQANGNTVTGISVHTFPEAAVISEGENFMRFFSGSDRLRVRRGRQIPSDRALVIEGRRVPVNIVRYNSTILDLEGFNRINAGTSVPPRRCDVG